MSLRYALLGLLARAPASGYDLTRQFDGSLGRYAWQARHTRIYPELARLADDGAVVASEPGPRGRRTYTITEAGRADLLAWLSDPTEHLVVRNESVLRMFMLSAVPPADAHRLLVREVAESDRRTRELREISAARDRETKPGEPMPFGRLAAEFGARLWEARRDWAVWASQHLGDR